MNLYKKKLDYRSTLWKVQIAYYKPTNKHKD